MESKTDSTLNMLILVCEKLVEQHIIEKYQIQNSLYNSNEILFSITLMKPIELIQSQLDVGK